MRRESGGGAAVGKWREPQERRLQRGADAVDAMHGFRNRMQRRSDTERDEAGGGGKGKRQAPRRWRCMCVWCHSCARAQGVSAANARCKSRQDVPVGRTASVKEKLHGGRAACECTWEHSFVCAWGKRGEWRETMRDASQSRTSRDQQSQRVVAAHGRRGQAAASVADRPCSAIKPRPPLRRPARLRQSVRARRLHCRRWLHETPARPLRGA